MVHVLFYPHQTLLRSYSWNIADRRYWTSKKHPTICSWQPQKPMFMVFWLLRSFLRHSYLQRCASVSLRLSWGWGAWNFWDTLHVYQHSSKNYFICYMLFFIFFYYIIFFANMHACITTCIQHVWKLIDSILMLTLCKN
jgi:hypothetical protein